MNRREKRAKGMRRVVVGTQELVNGTVLPLHEWKQVLPDPDAGKPKHMTREEIIEHMKAAGKLQIITA